jgi:hypothetical protein
MKDVTTTPELSHSTTESNSHLFDDWFDPIETGIRDRVRGLIEEMIRGELDAVLSRPRYGRQARHADGSDAAAGIAGHRHGSRARTLMGTFGKTEINVPRARLNTCDGKTTEWKSQGLRSYQRRTLAADALIAGTYLAGTNTRRVRRALGALFGGAVGKDTVSRVWRKVKGDWDAWNARSLADEPIVRLILDGTVVRVRLAPAWSSRRTRACSGTPAATPSPTRGTTPGRYWAGSAIGRSPAPPSTRRWRRAGSRTSGGIETGRRPVLFSLSLASPLRKTLARSQGNRHNALATLPR